MLLSMTGYGRAEAKLGKNRFLLEIRSVNHRFCEISVRLPRSLSMLEAKIRERVQSRISRGKVTIGVSLDGQESSAVRLKLNEEVAAAYLAVGKRLEERFGVDGRLELAPFLSLPDVLSWEQEEFSDEEAWKQLLPALDHAIEDILSMKRQEGEIVARDLRARLDRIEETLNAVVERMPEVIAHYRQRLADRLAEISEDLEYNQNRLDSELTLFVDRSDCTEECVRLRSHLQQYRELIEAPEPAGRKLNFLLQEMNRETNTIGSKTQDVPVARSVIEIKEEIEKLREQIQNFE